MISIALVAPVMLLACAWLNRVRGGGLGGQYLPGRALYWVAPAMGLVAWTVLPWTGALAVALGYLAWGIPGWGKWMDLGRMPDDWNEGDLDPFGEMIDALDLSDHAALFLRHLLVAAAVVPLAWLTSWWLLLAIPVFAGLAVGVYEIAWRVDEPDNVIQDAELVAGELWGVLILAAALLAG